MLDYIMNKLAFFYLQYLPHIFNLKITTNVNLKEHLTDKQCRTLCKKPIVICCAGPGDWIWGLKHLAVVVNVSCFMFYDL